MDGYCRNFASWAAPVALLACVEREPLPHEITSLRVAITDPADPGSTSRRLPDSLRSVTVSVQALDELLQQGHTVYVHCSAGINRAPSTVVAYFHWIRGLELDDAVHRVKTCRQCEPYLEAIVRATEHRLRRKSKSD